MDNEAAGSQPTKVSGANLPSAPTQLDSTGAHVANDPPQTETVLAPSQLEGSEDSAATDLNSTQAHESTKGPAAGTLPFEQAAAAKPGPGKGQKTNTLGDYRLLAKLGEGGMGTVFKAHQVSLDRDVAVKVLSKHLASNPDFVQRFQREARIMAKLDHPNILRCFGVGEEHGYHYFAMEFIEGGSMQSVLDKEGKLSVGDALYVILACGRGLQHAHEQNMIHRDIKPDNILVTKKGVVKVADMGLAKAHGENVSLTRTGTGAGTPIYMSPEQARDAKHVDHRSDIYSLACMLYTFLAGQPPFAGETYVELFEAKEKAKFDPIRKFNDEVPERLGLIIDKMLAKKPEVRYQTCAELIKDLEGLGLANTTLSFLEEGRPPAGKGECATEYPTGLPGQTRMATSIAKKPADKSVAGAAKGKGDTRWAASDRDTWHLSYRNSQGRIVQKTMNTVQVKELIRDDGFDLKAQAKQGDDGGFRALATYPEFESVLRGRIAKVRADTKTAKFQNIYKKLEREEISRQRWKWFRRLYEATGGWVLFLFYMAVLGVAIYLGYLGVKYGMAWLAKRWEKAIGQNLQAPPFLYESNGGFANVSEHVSTTARFFQRG